MAAWNLWPVATNKVNGNRHLHSYEDIPATATGKREQRRATLRAGKQGTWLLQKFPCEMKVKLGSDSREMERGTY